jgi:hypothetical protein
MQENQQDQTSIQEPTVETVAEQATPEARVSELEAQLEEANSPPRNGRH